jgi:hypothetical protein
MFKVAKLKQIKDEKVDIKVVSYEKRGYQKEPQLRHILSFKISGYDYSLRFMLNITLEKLNAIPDSQDINLSKYLFGGETYLYTKYDNNNYYDDTNLNLNIVASKFDNEFNLQLNFYSFDCQKPISGIAEIKFNLNDYLPSNEL